MRDYLIRAVYSFVALLFWSRIGIIIFAPVIFILAAIADYNGWKSEDVL